ncbi:MAG: 3-oxoacyl-[acyl-carrier-protein] reductase FabG [Phycisphaerae bacterium]|nr:3-oxoacyl-[acyl-carrier-protein] reductase FabG [Phycisphaerae bacterium]
MSDRAVVISGGSRGLGLALVRRFLQLGDRVATFSRTPGESLEQLAREHGERLIFDAADVSDSAAVIRAVRRVHERFGRIDALVNNAGLARDGVLATMSDQAILQTIQVNLLGAIWLAREASRVMLLGGGGRIVNVSSIVGLRGYSGLGAYSATKAGLLGLTRSLARELGGRNITVNAVAPGFLETEMSEGLNESQKAQISRRTPLGRLGTVEDVVGVVEFLLSDSARFITGQTIVIDGGISC